jgi:dihydrofolate synthase/folylpolyglutamate synthase
MAIFNLVDRLKPVVEAINQEAKYGKLTTFELLTTLAFLHFSYWQVDFQVIETGLGGRLDATNVVQPEICVITTIGFDHMDVLGNSLSEIATEKAGIIKPGSVVVSSPQQSEAANVIEKKCIENNTKLIRASKDVSWQSLGFDAYRQLIEVKGRMATYRIDLPLLGDCQQENAAVAVAALEVLVENGFNITHDNIVHGLETVSWPGRFQVIMQKPLIVIDGAHNQASIRQFKLTLAGYIRNCMGFKTNKDPFNKAILIIGVSADKDIAGIVSELCLLFNKVIITRSRHPRAMATGSIATEFGKYELEVDVTQSVSEAISLAFSEAGEGDLICITGSLFVAGEAVEYLGRVKKNKD